MRKGYPTFSWKTVPLFAHVGKTPGEFTDQEVEFLASRFHTVTIEKAHGLDQHGSTEPGTLADIEKLKTANPKLKVIFYLNSFIHYQVYEASQGLERRHPDWILRNDDGEPIRKNNSLYLFNLAHPDLREWWTDFAARMVRQGGADGVFLDALVQVHAHVYRYQLGPEAHDRLTEGAAELFKLLRKKVGPEAILLYNGIRSHNVLGSLTPPYQDLADGMLIECLGVFASTSFKETMALDVEQMLAAGKNGKIIMFKGWPNFTFLDREMKNRPHDELYPLMRERITFDLAVFLVVANPYSYFAYTWGYRHNHGAFDWYPEFDEHLGAPLGPPRRDGWQYNRSFEHASVRVDLETREARIDWG